MRISLIGPGDVDFHFTKLLGMSPEETERNAEEIGKVLADSGVDIVLTPDRGISLKIAKIFRKNRPRGKIYGVVPKSDLDYGMGHLMRYMEMEVDGEPLFDEFIDAGNWYKLDMCKAATGDDILFLGKTLGSIGEFAMSFYIYKLLSKKKPEVKIERNDIGRHIRAGKIIPFTAIVYLPFVKERLDYELESYVERVGGRIIYVKNVSELQETLKKVNDEFRRNTF